MADLIASGPAENRVFYQKYLAPTDLYNKLMLRNLAHVPFSNNWDGTSAPTMAYILYYARSQLKIQRAVKKMILPAVMAEFLGPYMDQESFADRATGQAEVVNLVKFIIGDQALLAMLSTGGSKASYEEAVTQMATGLGPFTVSARNIYGQFANDDWPEAANIGEMNLDMAIRILFYLASTAQIGIITRGLDLIVYITVSICKRGTVSDRFCTKIEDGIKADLNQTISLDIEVISTFYTTFANNIDQNNIATVKERWENLMPPNALRLRLTIEQLAGSGLTAFITVGRALRKYDDFDWVTIALLFEDDILNYNRAVTEVNGNRYYGFKKNLDNVRSTLYANLAYIAKELLIQVGGETSLKNYRGWKGRVPEQGTVDQLIADYINTRGARLNQPNVEVPEYDELRVNVDDNVNNNIFQG